MADYRLTNTSGVVRTSDGSFIPDDPDNRDRVAYVAWLSAGNVADPFITEATSTPTEVSISPEQALKAVAAMLKLSDDQTAALFKYAAAQ